MYGIKYSVQNFKFSIRYYAMCDHEIWVYGHIPPEHYPPDIILPRA